MDGLNDDCLINIFSQLHFLQKIRLELVCRRWLHILRGHAVHSKMQNLILADFVRENRLIEFSNGNDGPILLEQTLGGILDRAGPFVQQIDFNHRWPTISPIVVQKITETCSQLTKLDMGWVRFDADISPLLDKIAEQLVEFSLEESSWREEELAAKVPKFFEKMRNLRRLNLRKFSAPLGDLVKMEGGKLEFLDVSEAAQLPSDILIDFLDRNPQLLCLHLCPMPRQCLPIVADSTTSAFNRPGPFLGFVRQKSVRKTVDHPCKAPKKGADLQAIIVKLGKMPWLRTLWIGHISYSSHFLKLDALGEIVELRHLHVKDINSLDGNALKIILPGLRDHIRQLSLLNCAQIDDFSPLPICAFLTQLDVEGGKKLTDESIQGLAQHGRLKIVRINCCPKVSDAAIWSLVEKCPLKELELIKCPAISANLFANSESFKKCEKLERFSLSGCEAITNQSIVDAVNGANIWENIQQLDLSRNMNLDDSPLGMVKEALERMKAKRNGKTLIVYCTGTGISREPIDRFEPFIELAFY